MREEKLMEAIGGLDDRFVMEFAQPEAAKPRPARWLLPVAASLCLLAGAIGLYFAGGTPPMSMHQPFLESTVSKTEETAIPTESTVPEITAPVPTGATIWGYGALNYEMPKDYGKLGVISLDSSVLRALERVNDPADVLAVYVRDVRTGEKASNQEIYEQVLKPLGSSDESFLETDYTFLTEEQILTMECPENMSIIICMKYKVIPLTREYVESTDQEFFYVEGGIHRLSEDVKEGYTLFLGYEDDVQQRNLMFEFWQKRNAQRLQALFDYLGLEDWVVYEGLESFVANGGIGENERIERHGLAASLSMRFQGTMNREQVMKLLEAMETGSYGEVWAEETDGFGRGGSL